MKKISCAERIFRSAQDLYKKRAAAGFNPAAAFMRSRLSEKKSEVNGGIDRRRRFFFSGHFGDRGIIHAAIGTDLVCACSVTCDVGVSDGCNCAELHGDLNADILADGEHTGAAADALTGYPTGSDHRGATALGSGGAGLGKGGHRYRDADGCGLIAYGRAGLDRVLGNDIIKHLK